HIVRNLLARHEKDIEVRNLPLTDEELDKMLPQEGFKILELLRK
ncbi:splicing factor 3B subunit 1, partial [Tanacetum coccineum]